MHKRFLVALLTALLLLVFVLPSEADAPIKILFNGNMIETDTPPQIINDRVMVPLRSVSEALGCGVTWSGNDREVLITSNKKVNNTKRPSVEGPDWFVKQINDSFDYLESKDYWGYLWILGNTEKISYLPDSPDNINAIASRAAGSNITVFYGNLFQGDLSDFTGNDKLLFTIGTLAHESTHGYIFSGALSQYLVNDDQEPVCELIGLRFIQNVGGNGTKAEAEFKKSVINQLKL